MNKTWKKKKIKEKEEEEEDLVKKEEAKEDELDAGWDPVVLYEVFCVLFSSLFFRSLCDRLRPKRSFRSFLSLSFFLPSFWTFLFILWTAALSLFPSPLFLGGRSGVVFSLSLS